MGKLENIAEVLEEEADWLPDVPDSEEKFEKSFGSFTVRCSPTRLAVQEMAKKFRKKRRFTTKHKLGVPTMNRKYSADIYDRFVRDGETLNAVNYNMLFDREVVFSAGRGGKPDLLVIKGGMVREGFMVGRVISDGDLSWWNVYHIDTGMTCKSLASDKKGAVEKFKRIKEGDLQRAIENSKAQFGFQQRALKNALK